MSALTAPSSCVTPGQIEGISPRCHHDGSKCDELGRLQRICEEENDILGQGAFGIVYRSRSSTENWAIKCLKGSRQSSEMDATLQLTRKISQANINENDLQRYMVRIFHVCFTFDVIVMELAGNDLPTFISTYCKNGRKWNMDCSLVAVHDIARGVQLLQELGMVHHDLKPSNVVASNASFDFSALGIHTTDSDMCSGTDVTEDRRVRVFDSELTFKLCDYGQAADAQSFKGGEGGGTVGFRDPAKLNAPENPRDACMKIDVYSIGMVMLYLFLKTYKGDSSPEDRQKFLTDAIKCVESSFDRRIEVSKLLVSLNDTEFGSETMLSELAYDEIVKSWKESIVSLVEQNRLSIRGLEARVDNLEMSSSLQLSARLAKMRKDIADALEYDPDLRIASGSGKGDFCGREWCIEKSSNSRIIKRVTIVRGVEGTGKTLLLGKMASDPSYFGCSAVVTSHRARDVASNSDQMHRFVGQIVVQLCKDDNFRCYLIRCFEDINSITASLKNGNHGLWESFYDLIVKPLAKKSLPEKEVWILIDDMFDSVDSHHFLDSVVQCEEWPEWMRLVVSVSTVDAFVSGRNCESFSQVCLSLSEPESRRDFTTFVKDLVTGRPCVGCGKEKSRPEKCICGFQVEEFVARFDEASCFPFLVAVFELEDAREGVKFSQNANTLSSVIVRRLEQHFRPISSIEDLILYVDIDEEEHMPARKDVLEWAKSKPKYEDYDFRGNYDLDAFVEQVVEEEESRAARPRFLRKFCQKFRSPKGQVQMMLSRDYTPLKNIIECMLSLGQAFRKRDLLICAGEEEKICFTTLESVLCKFQSWLFYENEVGFVWFQESAFAKCFLQMDDSVFKPDIRHGHGIMSKWLAEEVVGKYAGLKTSEDAKLYQYAVPEFRMHNFDRSSWCTVLQHAEESEDDGFINGAVQSCVKFYEQGSEMSHTEEISPLIWAAGDGKTPILEALVQNVKDSTLGDDRDCPLNLNWVSSKGSHALGWAATKGHLDSCEILVNHGADVDLQKEQHHRTALDFACQRGHLDVVSFLESKGARLCDESYVAAAKSGSIALLDWLEKKHAPEKLDKLAKGQNRMPDDSPVAKCVHEAVSGGEPDVLNWLVKKTPFETYVRQTYVFAPNLPGWLLSPHRSYPAKKKSLMWLAAMNGHASMFQLLYKMADKKLLPSGDVLLHAASSGGSLELVKFLLEKCVVDPCVTTCYDHPLIRAAKMRRFEVFEYLKERMAICKTHMKRIDDLEPEFQMIASLANSNPTEAIRRFRDLQNPPKDLPLRVFNSTLLACQKDPKLVNDAVEIMESLLCNGSGTEADAKTFVAVVTALQRGGKLKQALKYGLFGINSLAPIDVCDGSSVRLFQCLINVFALRGDRVGAEVYFDFFRNLGGKTTLPFWNVLAKSCSTVEEAREVLRKSGKSPNGYSWEALLVVCEREISNGTANEEKATDLMREYIDAVSKADSSGDKPDVADGWKTLVLCYGSLAGDKKAKEFSEHNERLLKRVHDRLIGRSRSGGSNRKDRGLLSTTSKNKTSPGMRKRGRGRGRGRGIGRGSANPQMSFKSRGRGGGRGKGKSSAK